jgi:hypothetical protein
LARKRHPDGLIGVETTASGGADGGERIGSPHGAEAGGGLAAGSGGTQFTFAAVVVGADLGVVKEG